MHSSLLIFSLLSWSGLAVGSTGLIRPDVPDAPKSAIAPAIAGDFLDQQYGIAPARAGSAAATLRIGEAAGWIGLGLLFHQLQQGTPALGLRRFRLLQSFRRLIRQYRIA
jgi:hypothetical protein